jgi:hypothetical protein
MLVAFFPLRADDAYIVARYAEQWQRGNGLVYNVGERVDMLTSPLHAGVAIALRAVTADVVAAYQIAAALLVAMVLVAVAWKRWRGDAAGSLFLALTLASPLVAFWTVGGLETPILLAICTTLACLCVRAEPATAATAIAVLALSTLAVLTRYDAVLFAGPIGLASAWRYRRDPRVLAIACACAIALGAWLAFSVHYYEDLLPTSFYVKAGHAPGARELALGLVYVASFAVLSLAWMSLLLPGNKPVSRALAVGIALTLAYGVFAGTKHMLYLYRLFVPFLPALALALIPLRAGNRAVTLALVALAWQGALAYFIYAYSENPSLSLLVESPYRDRETFEFSHLGARHTAAFLSAVEAQVAPVRAHWTGNRPPRLVVSTGGMLPYRLPDAYVLEMLASYRHRCRPDLAAMADYQQVIYPAAASDQVAAERRAQGQELVHRQTFRADGLRAEPLELALEIWYQPNPQPLTLPSTIARPCVSALPSPPRK